MLIYKFSGNIHLEVDTKLVLDFFLWFCFVFIVEIFILYLQILYFIFLFKFLSFGGSKILYEANVIPPSRLNVLHIFEIFVYDFSKKFVFKLIYCVFCITFQEFNKMNTYLIYIFRESFWFFNQMCGDGLW